MSHCTEHPRGPAMTAVVMREHGSCAVEELELVGPGRTDVVVRIEASGICHSDVAVLTGDLAVPLPVVLGPRGRRRGRRGRRRRHDCAARRPRRAVGDPDLRAVLLLRPRRALPLRPGGRHLAGRVLRRGHDDQGVVGPGHVLRRRRRVRAGGRARSHRPTGRAAGAPRLCRGDGRRFGDQPGIHRARRQRARHRRRRDRVVRDPGGAPQGGDAADRRRPGGRQPRPGDPERSHAHLRPAWRRRRRRGRRADERDRRRHGASTASGRRRRSTRRGRSPGAAARSSRSASPIRRSW